jgi:hypothetical protein
MMTSDDYDDVHDNDNVRGDVDDGGDVGNRILSDANHENGIKEIKNKLI